MSSRQFEKEEHCKSHFSKCSKTIYIYVQIQREKEESAWVKYITLNFYRQFTNLCEQTLLAFSFMYCCFFGGFCLFVHMKEVFWGTISLFNLTSLVISGSRCYFGFQNQRNKKAPLRVQIMSAPIKRSTKKRIYQVQLSWKLAGGQLASVEKKNELRTFCQSFYQKMCLKAPEKNIYILFTSAKTERQKTIHAYIHILRQFRITS